MYVLAKLRSPASSDKTALKLRSAHTLFDRFHCFAPERVVRQRCRRLIPKVLVNVGELRGLIYKSDKRQRGRPQTYVHFMETPARLACDPEGRQLYIIGGNYRITERGIDG